MAKRPKTRGPKPAKAKPALEITVELKRGAQRDAMLDAIRAALEEQIPLEVLEAGETIIVTNKIGNRSKK